jgi:hypothetical protein
MMAKGEAKIREQARSYKNSSKPPIVGAAIAQGCAGAAKHMDVRERPWPRTFQSVKPNAEFAGKPAPTRDHRSPGL